MQIDAAINSGNSGTQEDERATWTSLFMLLHRQSSSATGQMFKAAQIVEFIFAGGPVFNQAGQCVGIAFQSLSGGDAENIG